MFTVMRFDLNRPRSALRLGSSSSRLQPNLGAFRAALVETGSSLSPREASQFAERVRGLDRL